MSIFGFKKWGQPYADDEYDDFDEELEEFDSEQPQEEKSSGRRPSPFANFGTSRTGGYTASATASAPAQPAQPSHSTGFSGQVINMNGSRTEIHLYSPATLADAAEGVKQLRENRAVLANLEKVEAAASQRIVDCLSGATYALEGTVRAVATKAYLFCPHNVTITGELEHLLGRDTNI